MCQGQQLRNDVKSPAAGAASSATVRLAVSNADLAAARARLAESVAELERERARAADLRRRLAESYAERDRLRNLASVMSGLRSRIRKRRLQLLEADEDDGGDAAGR